MRYNGVNDDLDANGSNHRSRDRYLSFSLDETRREKPPLT
jgi:hypothetical protein